jgi:hypothetical protein
MSASTPKALFKKKRNKLNDVQTLLSSVERVKAHPERVKLLYALPGEQIKWKNDIAQFPWPLGKNDCDAFRHGLHLGTAHTLVRGTRLAPHTGAPGIDFVEFLNKLPSRFVTDARVVLWLCDSIHFVSGKQKPSEKAERASETERQARKREKLQAQRLSNLQKRCQTRCGWPI